MSGAPSPAVLLSTDESAGRYVGQACDLAVAQTCIDPLAQPRLFPRIQAGQYADGCIHTRRQVRNCNTYLDGWPVSFARDVHEAHFSFDHDVVACAVAVRACLAVACDGGIDERWVDLRESLVVEGVFFQRAGKVVFY